MASFLRDLWRGDPWICWYFSAFHSWRGRSNAEIFAGLLRDHSACWTHILGYLRLWGLLPSISLQSAPVEELLAAWLAADAENPSFRPLLEAAWRIGASLGWWNPTPEPTPLAVAHAARQVTIRPDWTSTAALAEAVYCGLCHWRRAAATESTRVQPTKIEEAHVRAAVAGYDWLDRDRLAKLIAEWPLAPGEAGASTASPHIDRALDFLAREIRAGRLTVNPAAPPTLQALECIGAWAAAIYPETLPPEVQLPLLRALTVSRFVEAGPWTATAIARSSPETKPGPAVAGVNTVAPADRESWKPTRNAGLFLLVRTLRDLRWEPLLRRLVPGDPAQFTLFLQQLAPHLASNADVDAAMLVWAGLDRPCADPPVFPLGELVSAHRERLPGALLACEFPAGGDGYARLAGILLAHWRRWVRGFGESSEAFTRQRLLPHNGAVRQTHDAVEVWLERGDLDTVLEMAGYFEPVTTVEWWNGRSLVFHRSPK